MMNVCKAMTMNDHLPTLFFWFLKLLFGLEAVVKNQILKL
jgi:hypothetical protein